MTRQHGRTASGAPGAAHPPVSSTADTVDLRLPAGVADGVSGGAEGGGEGGGERTAGRPWLRAAPVGGAADAYGLRTGNARGAPGTERSAGPPPGRELLGDIAAWGPVAVRTGSFRLVPVRADPDLPLVSRWLGDPAAVLPAPEPPGPADSAARPDPMEAAARRLRAQHGGDGRSVPCLGLLDGVPISYWEVYRADLSPLARHYPTRPHDTGVRLLIGAAADRGRGLGSALLRAVSGLVLDNRPSCTRVVGEPDLCDTPSVAAFLRADFRFSAEVDLPGRRAAVLIHDRFPHGPR
ncbi:GNAT family N-acetyltransferase [Streptomyces sp. F63]|uniref:GNAT family N-acetyltransferase n=1 Tax=Streptomyces sp. F63 TaxID=2824887 RepID=UPI001B37EACF|nr:GNAT family N-acetyltransferase [Streptomyces sp. F63]MBQ0985489.1 GNAT family N-acetyltransferase [Streptomyces sp. F63]